MGIVNLDHSQLLQRYPALKVCERQIIDGINLLATSYADGGKLITMGNGGSSADAEHICGELVKSFRASRKLSAKQIALFQGIDETLPSKIQGSLPAISLGVQHSTISAFANDMDAVYHFAQQIWGLANKNDVVMGISTSGNSMNVVHAMNVAKAKGIATLGLTGEKESKVSAIATVCIRAPAKLVHHIQELHLPIYHSICLELENLFFPEKGE
jgi:D-sedoheptulose 7-phosphate isomerase